ncbi:acylneuraminate cytidylyltransferase family protein [Legionella clemsonensis]|uniref:CMP-N,N'-diacetyllegionaminic acid synthase n=1 Tax=Legionella clemsonensis TaxID=1867846 RepID=A0A222P3N8_9GAMM|nr:acylneuraminate cytidylyltransferase family protein [Legionella clemsonensis]ASQ46442.1 CMP-N,N'-diacetyllegionaminic acid synthase [Legionella clemsonensis]
MKILAIIPARSGSKRLPGKNIKSLAGMPLIAYSIIAAQKANVCSEILVSTDCHDIAEVALHYGASVPWLRSANLAHDLSDVIHTVIDTIKRCQSGKKDFDSVLLLQPTSPFRSSSFIKEAVKLHKQTGESVVSVSTPTIKPAWFRTVDEEGNLISSRIMSEYENDLASAKFYQLNGSIYLATVKQILKHNSFYSQPTKALLIENPHEAIDIDTSLDWILAEKLMESKEEEVIT